MRLLFDSVVLVLIRVSNVLVINPCHAALIRRKRFARVFTGNNDRDEPRRLISLRRIVRFDSVPLIRGANGCAN
jgi:hypothetical protein